MTESEKRTLQQSLREAWGAALGRLNRAESEITRAAERLLESIGLGPDAPGAEDGPAQLDMAELVRRLRRNQEALERRVDQAVQAAVARIGAPILDELATLRQRIERLQRRVEEMKGQGGEPAAGHDEAAPDDAGRS
jgi:hypothetical protein